MRAWLTARGGGTAPAITSLAVLPLKRYSGDASQDFFADGTTGALIAGLVQTKALEVISRTPVMHDKDSKKPLPEIAKELGVDGIVEGLVLPVLPLEIEIHDEAAALRNPCRGRGARVGTIAALLAQLCLRHGLRLLTADRDFEAMARHCPLALLRPS